MQRINFSKIFTLETYNVTPSAYLFIRYLKFISFGTIISLIFIITLNYFINPYSIYSAPRIDGINNNKPVLFKYLRLTKAYAVADQEPDALIIGSSRSEHGLDPEHPVFKDKYKVFNLSLSGASIYENLRYLQHANEINSLKLVILAIDFFQFNAYRPPAADFSDARLRTDVDGNPNSVSIFTDTLATLASLDALVASVKTVSQQENYSNVILANGQVMQPDEDAILKFSGHRREAAMYSELNYISHLYFPRPHKKFDFINEDASINTFDYFKKILQHCYKHNNKLIILISPAHARQWELIYSTGLWDKFEFWKQEMVRLNDKFAKQHNLQPFPIWDFSGFNSYTTEPVPKLGDNTSMMKWYWESSHYRAELGDLVLDRIFDYQHPERIVAEDFGIKLTPQNVVEHLQKTDRDRIIYERSHEDEVQEIISLVRKYQSRQ